MCYMVMKMAKKLTAEKLLEKSDMQELLSLWGISTEKRKEWCQYKDLKAMFVKGKKATPIIGKCGAGEMAYLDVKHYREKVLAGSGGESKILRERPKPLYNQENQLERRLKQLHETGLLDKNIVKKKRTRKKTFYRPSEKGLLERVRVYDIARLRKHNRKNLQSIGGMSFYDFTWKNYTPEEQKQITTKLVSIAKSINTIDKLYLGMRERVWNKILKKKLKGIKDNVICKVINETKTDALHVLDFDTLHGEEAVRNSTAFNRLPESQKQKTMKTFYQVYDELENEYPIPTLVVHIERFDRGDMKELQSLPNITGLAVRKAIIPPSLKKLGE